MRTWLLTLFLVLLPLSAHASFCKAVSSEEVKDIYYAGVLKIVSARPAKIEETPYKRDMNDPAKLLPPPGRFYTVQPIQPYLGEQTENFEVWHNGATDGWGGPETKDAPFVDIIIKLDGVPSFTKLCSPAAELEKLGIKPPEEITAAFAQEKEKCAKEGKQLRFAIHEGFCDTPTTDYKKECSANSDCEGYCLVSMSKEEYQRGYRPETKTGNGKVIPDENPLVRWREKYAYGMMFPFHKNGQCSEWKLVKGCFHTPGHLYEGQKVIREECEY